MEQFITHEILIGVVYSILILIMGVTGWGVVAGGTVFFAKFFRVFAPHHKYIPNIITIILRVIIYLIIILIPSSVVFYGLMINPMIEYSTFRVLSTFSDTQVNAPIISEVVFYLLNIAGWIMTQVVGFNIIINDLDEFE